MTTFFEAGKGSTQRPTDVEKYKNNYDQIFRKPQPTTPITDAPKQAPTDSK